MSKASETNKKTGRVRLTPELLKRCLNEGMVSHYGLMKSDPEAALAIEQNPGTREWLNENGEWKEDRGQDEEFFGQSFPHRLSPDTKPDPGYTDYADVPVIQDGDVYGYTAPKEISALRLVRPVGYAISTVGFEGYVYGDKDADGKPVVRKQLDLDYGVPTHVRFRV